MAVDKNKALQTALSQIEKQFGKGAVMRLGQNEHMSVGHVSTGSLGLDIALGIGGLPRGRIIEIYGPESSGKTTLSLHCIAEGQKGPYTTGYSDNSGMVMNLEWLTKDYYSEGITEPWTGGILNWEESSLVTNGSTVNLIMNLQPTELFSGIFSAEEDICDIYIQFGVPGNLKDYPEFPEKTEEGDFFPAEETNVVTWKISGEDTTAGVTKGISTKENDLGKWQNIEIFLTEEQKVKIGNNTAIRIIVKPRVKGNQWASCKLQIREIMTSGMPFMISGGLKAAINKDPLYGSENSLENGSWGKTISSLNDDSNSVLEIQYTRTLSSLNPIEQGKNSLSVQPSKIRHHTGKHTLVCSGPESSF